ncbi:uncharacterized protein [Asterias amurensis]|uniref:uncharacterized protein n=1 Tax=Asterias amurensis TaxID=7602 RepID=UPI003AB1E19F
MSYGNVIVEVSRNNIIKTVSLDSSSHIYGWQVIQTIQDGEENSTASENIILRNSNGVRLLPTKKLQPATKKKTKTNLRHLHAQIMGEGGVKENGEQSDKVQRSYRGAGSESEHHPHSHSSTDHPEASKDTHQEESSQVFAPTENKKRKVQCGEAGDSSKHTFKKGITDDQTSSKMSTRLTDSLEHEVIRDLTTKPQLEDKRCQECGSTGARRSTIKIGFKRNHGWIGDESPPQSTVNLTLNQRGCAACKSNNDCQTKEPRKTKILGVISCVDTHTKTDSIFASKAKQVPEKGTTLKARISLNKGSFRAVSDKPAAFKSRYFPKGESEDSASSTNKTLEIKRKSAKSSKANTSHEPISSSTQINKEISGASLVESSDSSCGYASSNVNKSSKTSAEVLINTNSLHQWISTTMVADAGNSACDDTDVSTSDDTDCKVKSKQATKVTKERKVPGVISSKHSKNAEKEGDISTSKSEDQRAECSSTTDTLNETANSVHNKFKIIHTQGPMAPRKSATKCVDIVAKQFENGIQQKFHLINLQTVQSDPLDLVDNFVENGVKDGLHEPKEVVNNGEQSFIDDLHDDEINSIHTDCDSEEPDRGTQASSYISDDVVIINIGRNELRRSDLDTLQEGEWLNDCVINAYFILLGEVSPLNVFSHSSFFFWSLYKRGYEGVKRWTKNVDLFAQDVIFIPVHNKSHWTLVAVDVKKGIIEYYNSSTFHDGYPHSVKHIQQYLKDEAVHRGKTEFCNFNWEMFILDQIPRQQNSDDCGLFICQYAKKICLQQKMNFNAERTNVLRQQMLHELMHEEIDKEEPKDGKS